MSTMFLNAYCAVGLCSSAHAIQGMLTTKSSTLKLSVFNVTSQVLRVVSLSLVWEIFFSLYTGYGSHCAHWRFGVDDQRFVHTKQNLTCLYTKLFDDRVARDSSSVRCVSFLKVMVVGDKCCRLLLRSTLNWRAHFRLLHWLVIGVERAGVVDCCLE